MEQLTDLKRQRDCIATEVDYLKTERNGTAVEFHNLTKDIEEMRVMKSNEQMKAAQMSNDIASLKGEMVRLREVKIFMSKMHQLEIENITGGIPPELVHKLQHEKARKMQVDDRLKEFEQQYSNVLKKQKMHEINRLVEEVKFEKNQIENLDEEYERKQLKKNGLEFLINSKFKDDTAKLRFRQQELLNDFEENSSEYRKIKMQLNEEIMRMRKARLDVINPQIDEDKKNLDNLIQMNLKLQSEIMVYKATIDATFGTLEEGLQFNAGFMPPNEVMSEKSSRLGGSQVLDVQNLAGMSSVSSIGRGGDPTRKNFESDF